jgi:rhodanese-related sulfurtransferase
MKIHRPLFLALATQAKTQIKEIDVHEANKRLTQGTAVFIDVREESEWKQGHLLNAIHLSKGVIERNIEKYIPESATPLVLYCSGGYRSALATLNIQALGYKNVCSMQGGISAWANAGYSLHFD